MIILNLTDFKVLSAIRNVKKQTGLTELNGSDRDTILETFPISSSTLNRSLKKLLEVGYIKEGIKKGTRKKYYITKEGLMKIKEVKLEVRLSEKEDN